MAKAAFEKIEEGLKEAIEASKTINLAAFPCSHSERRQSDIGGAGLLDTRHP